MKQIVKLSCVALSLMLLTSCLEDGTSTCAVYYDESTSGREQGVLDGTHTKLAQSFILGTVTSFDLVKLGLQKRGTISNTSPNFHTVTVRIETSTTCSNLSDSCPSGTLVTGGSGTYRTDYISEAGSRYSIPLEATTSLSATTEYWVVLSGTYPANKDHHIRWVGHDTDDGLTTGNGLTQSAGDWSFFDLGTFFDFNFSLGC